MKRAIFSVIPILLLASVCSLAQTAATNGTVVLTPGYGSTAIVPGAAIFASGRNWHEGTRGYEDPLGLINRFRVTIQPGNINCHRVQVSPDTLFFFIPFAAPVGMTSITIGLMNPNSPIIDAPFVWTEVIPLTIARTSPTIRGEGRWRTFREPQEHVFSNNVLVFPRSVGIIAVALFGNNFGAIADWVVRVQGNGVNFELLSYQEPLSPVYSTPYLYLQMPIVPAGDYQISAYPLQDPGILSNTITLAIQ